MWAYASPVAGFEIDDRKLERALPAPTSSTAEDLKIVSGVIGGALLLVGSLVALVASLFVRL